MICLSILPRSGDMVDIHAVPFTDVVELLHRDVSMSQLYLEISQALGSKLAFSRIL